MGNDTLLSYTDEKDTKSPIHYLYASELKLLQRKAAILDEVVAKLQSQINNVDRKTNYGTLRGIELFIEQRLRGE